MLLVSAGSNARGQLATGDQEDAHTFTKCCFEGYAPGQLPQGTQTVVQITCGANHTLLLLERTQDTSSSTRRELWSCGDGSKSQLGSSVVESSSVFVPLNLELQSLGLEGYTVQTVAACWETSFVALTHPDRSDVLLSMGSDDFGNLGIGGTKGKSTRCIHRVPFGGECLGTDDPCTIRVLSLAAGPHHVAIRLSAKLAGRSVQERLVGWGTSRHGQLGDLKITRMGRPVPFVDSPWPVALPVGNTLKEFSLGNQHSVFLLSSGRLYGIGSNRRGQLNEIDQHKDVSSVSCTWNGTYVVMRQNSTWTILSLGASHKGQLGRQIPNEPDHTTGIAPAPVEFPFGADTRELIKVACGSEHVLCLFSLRDALPGDTASSQREVWAWGWNEHGTLGDGTTEDRNFPQKVWPPDESSRRAVDISAGCGNSWIVLEG
ncbi:uncharacterized protein PHACADRAFT_168753 [Phanerochaete carnosa HHB-10118-sp]|uniref:RCC1-like domain-containing protein n=1 Tax=Phanerochaete carnosa (strain HHB-10118-sp) TaxID=650164 RepID=K5VEB7_PHACS|nr:uncharacterized protein PHACADRAFT_168753 [Phanerochaete carnosa HHB-10118-sp]EKM61316.1 hypothetical protein PHACADRAFT_168753 [Phanerochaete carnosa HHB-10118-sp]